MKLNLVAVLSFAFVVSACSSNAEDVFGNFDGIGKGGSAESVTGTYLSDCQSAGNQMSYRLRVVETSSGALSVLQRTYTDNGSCVGYDVAETPVEKSKISFVKMGNLISVTADGATVETREVNSREFGWETGLFVHYAGTVTSAGTAKPVTYFAQIIGRSPYSGNYPYIWTYRNGSEVNPRWNPWVSSGVLTSDTYQDRMAGCKNVQEIVVAAGKFKTCLFDHGGEKVWYGNVSQDGIVKYEKPEGIEPAVFGADYFAGSVGFPTTAAISFELTQFAN